MTVVFILMVLLVLVLGFILYFHHAHNKKRLHLNHSSGDTVYTIPSGSPSAKSHTDGCENNSYFGFGGDGGGDCGGGGGD